MKRVEVFTAGCGICSDLVKRIEEIACPSCVLIVRDTNDETTLERTRHLGIKFLPAVVVDNELVTPDRSEGYSEAILRRAGVGVPCELPPFNSVVEGLTFARE
jgi:glutaredoxin 3